MPTSTTQRNILSADMQKGYMFPTSLETFISPGLPYFSIIGMHKRNLNGIRERIKLAITNSGYEWPTMRVTVKLNPTSTPKDGRIHDLAIAASILAANNVIDSEVLADTVVLGELNENGDVLEVPQLSEILQGMRKRESNMQSSPPPTVKWQSSACIFRQSIR